MVDKARACDSVGEDPPDAKGFSHPAKKGLKDDREVEDVVMSYLVKRGQVIARTILKNYDIVKGANPTKIARLLAVMKPIAEKNPGLVVEGTSKDTKLRKGQEVPPQQPPQQETTTTQR
jgi:hypothetical protein